MSSHSEMGGSPKLQVETRANRYRRELSTRNRSLRGAVRDYIVHGETTLPSMRGNATPFQFESNADKQSSFDRWLKRSLADGWLEPMGEGQLRSGGHYTGQYVRLAVDAGGKWSAARMVEAGYSVPGHDTIPGSELGVEYFQKRVNRDVLESLYLRNYSQLEGIGSHADQQLSRIFSESVARGLSSQETASRLTKELRSIDRARGETMARTEFMRAHHRATTKAYRDFGVEKVEILLGTDPCDTCKHLADDNPYPLHEAEGLLPAHPRCTCALSVVV